SPRPLQPLSSKFVAQTFLVPEVARSTCVSVHTRFEDVFKSIVHNQNLMSLSLDCVPHSLEMVSLLESMARMENAAFSTLKEKVTGR
ncbi:hypothetical protein Celaphus_00004321, partial [Cervus elaphus hippelaphus]